MTGESFKFTGDPPWPNSADRAVLKLRDSSVDGTPISARADVHLDASGAILLTLSLLVDGYVVEASSVTINRVEVDL